MYSKKLSRQLKHILGSSAPETALRDWQAKAAEDPNLPAETKIFAANLSAFLDAVDEAYAHNDDQLRMAVRNLSISSDELTESNTRLEKLNITVKTMLESQGEGLFYFDKDGIVAPVFSKICIDLLEGDPGGRHLSDVLKLEPEAAQSLRSLIRLIFGGQDNVMGFDDLIGLAPSKYRHTRGLKIQLRYKPMHNPRGGLIGILAIAADRTGEEEAMRAIAERETEASRILRIARNRNGFVRFLKDFRLTFADADGRSAGDMARAIHTLKGQAAFFWLKDMAEALNELEQSIQASGHFSGGKMIEICRFYEPRLQGHLDSAIKIASDIWGERFEADGQMRTIEMDRIMNFTAHVGRRLAAHPDVADEIVAACLQDIAGLHIRDALRPFEAQIHDYADIACKQIGPVRFEGTDIVILPEAYTGVLDSLVHVASNIAEHGIESPLARNNAGKPREGTVTLRVTPAADGRSFMLEIGDDGGGIDVSFLRSRIGAAANDLNDHDLLQQIFGLHVTTRDSATATAGRGIGLNAVKNEVEKMQGRIEVHSKKGEGTTFCMTLPLVWTLEQDNQAPGIWNAESVRG